MRNLKGSWEFELQVMQVKAQALMPGSTAIVIEHQQQQQTEVLSTLGLKMLGSNKKIQHHTQHSLYSQITISDTRPHVKQAVNLVFR